MKYKLLLDLADKKKGDIIDGTMNIKMFGFDYKPKDFPLRFEEVKECTACLGKK